MKDVDIIIVTTIGNLIIAIGLVGWKYLWKNQLLIDSQELKKDMVRFTNTFTENNSYLKRIGEDTATKENIKEITDSIKSVESKYLEQLEFLKTELGLKHLKESAWFEKEKNVIFSFIEECFEFTANTIETRVENIEDISKNLTKLRFKYYKMNAFVQNEEITEQATKVYNNLFEMGFKIENLEITMTKENIKSASQTWETLYDGFIKKYEPLVKEFSELVRDYLK